MTVKRLPRRPYPLALVPLLALALITSACAGLASPKGWASPVLVESEDPEQEDIVLASHRDTLFALESQELATRWAFPRTDAIEEIDVDALYGEPAVMGDTAYIPGYDGNLYAIGISGDLAGAVRPGWPFLTNEPLVGGVALSEDTVYFGGSEGVFAVDAETGQQRWPPFKTDEAVWSTPTLEDDRLYATSLDGNLYVLDAATGELQWSFKTAGAIASPPVVDPEAGLVYVGGFDGLLRAVDIETQQQVWEVSADNWFWTRPLLANGVIYAGSLDGKVYAADTATGELVWPPFDVGDPIHSAPVISNGQLVVISREGNVHGINLDTGAPTLVAPVVLESDVHADPLVRVRSDENKEEVLLTTSDGDLLTLDGETLQVTGRRILES